MPELDEHLKPLLAELLLALADDKLMLGHRNSDWTGLGPILEEDIAFSSLAQDEMAHAQAIYELIGVMLDRDANELAFGRDPLAYRCAAIVEVADDFDWATAIARQLFCDHFDALRLGRLSRSSFEPLAALATRMAAEERIHCEHVDSWVRRLGQGTDDSRSRMQTALDHLAPIAPSLLEPVDGEEALVSAGIYPAEATPIFEQWSRAVGEVATAAGLRVELTEPGDAPGGRHGQHTDQLGPLLDEMCEVYRIEPGAAW